MVVGSAIQVSRGLPPLQPPLDHLPRLHVLTGFQPSIDDCQVNELASQASVAEADNLVLLGPPGVGKTHLSVALGL